MLTTQKKIQHLYWRAGFGITINELNKNYNKTLQGAINQLFLTRKPTFIDTGLNDISTTQFKGLPIEVKKKIRIKNRQDNFNVNATWVKQMVTSKNPLLERMTLFWHGHFACTSEQVPHFSENQNNTIRKYALGNFKDLVLAIAKDPAMIRFLNTQQNKKNKPNENFARELLELFTIGIGNYTETDIKEAARAFTGWQLNSDLKFVFNKKQHDFGSKTFFGKTGNFSGEQIIDIILEEKKTAQFIATKVYKYFVNEKINKTHIKQLTDVFYNSNYDIKTLMRTVFESDWFYNPKNIGTKIKSPVELLVGIMKTLNLRFPNTNSIILVEKALGQILFKPPNVAGWSGGRAWIDNAYLVFRLSLVNYLFQTAKLDITKKPGFEGLKNNIAIKRLEANININILVNEVKKKCKDENLIFETLTTLLIQPNLKLTKDKLDEFTINTNQSDYIQSLVLLLMTLPEYQMC